MGMLAYYWVLATPAVGFLFGCYLYIAVNWFHVHYDEAFSALRIPNFKGFSRLHINTDGDLEIYGLAMDKVKPDALCQRTLTASSPRFLHLNAQRPLLFFWPCSWLPCAMLLFIAVS